MATTITAINTDAQKTINQKASIAQDFDDFLRLLTTQLQNQDPLNPMDSNEFTNQLVQFSQVEQQINTNQKLDSISALQLSSSISAALGYVGLDASYVSNEASFDGETPVNITYSLERASRIAKMSIIDDKGETVYTKDVATTVGQNKVTWDGKDNDGNVMPDGTYTIQIDALDPDDAAVKSTIVVQGLVRGIETQDGTIHLLVGDRAVPIANVLNAAQPKPVVPATTTT
jgi:flagellar basal-body rod modification protein FlgD